MGELERMGGEIEEEAEIQGGTGKGEEGGTTTNLNSS